VARKRITKRAVDALKCPAGGDRAFLWDEDLSGFGVSALPSGKKVYVAQYRQGGRSRRVKIGDHGRLTPDEARSAAKKLLGAVEGGHDPIGQRREGRAARTLAQVAADFLALHARAKRKARTADEYDRILELHILPALGSRIMADIRKVDLSRLHGSLSASPGAANRVVALFSAVWNWAAKRDEVPTSENPTLHLERYPEKGRERYLTVEELRRLGRALREAETTGLPWVVDEKGVKAKHLPKAKRSRVIDPYAVAAIRLLMLTGARLREILDARWDYVDWQRGLMFLPDSKTGRKTIYLSDAAIDVLTSIPRLDGNPHIIPGETKGAPRADLKRPWAAMVRAAGLLEEVKKPVGKGKALKLKAGKDRAMLRPSLRLHDLRHTFAATGAGSSLGLPVIGKLLGHSQPQTTQRYAHLDADPMHKAANLIGSQIAAAMAPPVTIALPAARKGKKKGPH
jgi:integrase